jgi:hypothetical protein
MSQARPLPAPAASTAAPSSAGQTPTTPAPLFDMSKATAIDSTSTGQSAPPNDTLSKFENLGTGIGQTAVAAYKDIGKTAESGKQLLDQIFGYGASQEAKDDFGKGWTALKLGNVPEAQHWLRNATQNIVENHPVSQLLKQQWDSSARNLEASREDMKAGDHLATVQHVAGIAPIANLVSDAFDQAIKSPNPDTIAHAVITGVMALSPELMKRTKGASVIEESEAAPESFQSKQAELDAKKPEPSPSTSTEGPVASQVSKAVEGSGIAEGAPASEGMPTTVAPSGENIQPEFQSRIHDISKQAAKESGVPYSKPASIRDAVGTTGREVIKSSQADYKALDEASGGRWQRFKDQIDNIQTRMDEVNGIDDDTYEKLELKRNEIETLQSQMIEDIKAGGKVDPKIIDKANANYRKGMALHDLNNAVKASTKRTVEGGVVQETVDPTALSNRVSRLSDVPKTGGPSRLENALGSKGADNFTHSIDSAQIAAQEIKDFVPTKGVPTEATGKQALKTMVENATKAKGTITGGSKGITDWNSVRNQFERLRPDAQQKIFGADVDRLRMYINKQALRQSAVGYLKKGAAYAAGGAVGATGYKVAKELLQ